MMVHEQVLGSRLNEDAISALACRIGRAVYGDEEFEVLLTHLGRKSDNKLIIAR